MGDFIRVRINHWDYVDIDLLKDVEVRGGVGDKFVDYPGCRRTRHPFPPVDVGIYEHSFFWVLRQSRI